LDLAHQEIKGLNFASGEYIAFCDADDIWNKNKLKFQLKFMKRNKVFFSYSSYNIINKNGKKISIFKAPYKIKKEDLLKRCDIALSSVVCTKKILKNLKFLNTKTKEDYYLWLNIIKKTEFFLGINKNLLSWRNLDNSLSSARIQGILMLLKFIKFILKAYLYFLFFVPLD
jgi:teichuronic acid biosynthesis glycosyltransferase TuaG